MQESSLLLRSPKRPARREPSLARRANLLTRSPQQQLPSQVSTFSKYPLGKKREKSTDSKVEEDVGKKPTKAISGYFYFSAERVPEIKKGGITHQEAMKQAGAEWTDMSQEEKEPYEKLHEKDQKRYEHELKEFKDKGYFTMADGTRSDEIHEPGKKKRASKVEEASASKVGKSSRKKSAVKSKGGKSATKDVEHSTQKKSAKKDKENEEPVHDEHADILFGDKQPLWASPTTN